MNIDDLTLGQLKEISKIIPSSGNGLQSMVGKKVIVRTYSAGVHFGEIVEKDGTEVILKNARRLYFWKTANNGISLSEVANAGLHKDSKVCSPVKLQWLDAIELIACTDEAISNIENQNEYKA